jgi:hypothetical protein
MPGARFDSHSASRFLSRCGRGPATTSPPFMQVGSQRGRRPRPDLGGTGYRPRDEILQAVTRFLEKRGDATLPELVDTGVASRETLGARCGRCGKRELSRSPASVAKPTSTRPPGTTKGAQRRPPDERPTRRQGSTAVAGRVARSGYVSHVKGEARVAR